MVSAKPPGGPGAAIALPLTGAVAKKSPPMVSLTKIHFGFSHDDSRFWQLEHGFGGAVTSLTPARRNAYR